MILAIAEDGTEVESGSSSITPALPGTPCSKRCASEVLQRTPGRRPVLNLWPSIGNWDYHCRSHYVIRRGKVQWAPTMSDTSIAAGRDRNRWIKQARESDLEAPASQPEPDESRPTLTTRTGALLRRVIRRR